MLRNSWRSPKFFAFDASILIAIFMLLPVLMFGLPVWLVVIEIVVFSYYVYCAFSLKMSAAQGVVYLKTLLSPRRRPSRDRRNASVFYDVSGVHAWRFPRSNGAPRSTKEH